MFAEASVTLAFPLDRVERELTDPGQQWAASLDGVGGADLLAAVGVRLGAIPVYKHVRLTLGSPIVHIRPGRTVLPISWQAAGGPPLFPRMDGSLEVESVDASATRLTLKASYDPPLGRLGELVDRTLLNRLAAGTMKDFVVRVAERLQTLLADDRG